ncbi:MAG TPA: GTPase Era [Gammaproteobacteria bacterium]|nr:GTPase Era [Gammaproteobacteria bacterium]
MTHEYAGNIALIGRPNVGKSTLLNTLLQKSISIVTAKPQTTEIQIKGILTEPPYQMVFIDTPGLHKKIYNHKNRSMNQQAHRAIFDAHIIILMFEARRWTHEDDRITELVSKEGKPCIVVFNKVDQIKSFSQLLPKINALEKMLNIVSIIPVSARTKENTDTLLQTLKESLPQAPFIYPADDKRTTTLTDEQQITEIIRKHILLNLNRELPYQTTVKLTTLTQEPHQCYIHAAIQVKTASQKKILIGNKGQMIKKIGQSSRLELQSIWNKAIDLRLHIQKVTL